MPPICSKQLNANKKQTLCRQGSHQNHSALKRNAGNDNNSIHDNCKKTEDDDDEEQPTRTI